MKTIHKHALHGRVNKISTYERARVIHVSEQHNTVMVWLEVNSMERECIKTIHMLGTGAEVPHGTTHAGSAVCAGGQYVFHVYEEDE